MRYYSSRCCTSPLTACFRNLHDKVLIFQGNFFVFFGRLGSFVFLLLISSINFHNVLKAFCTKMSVVEKIFVACPQNIFAWMCLFYTPLLLELQKFGK
jgi:hypothetical protein